MLGVMSGTSLDGVDAAAVRLTGRDLGIRATLLAHTHVDYPPSVRHDLLRLCGRESSSVDLLSCAHFALPVLWASCVEACAADAGLPLSSFRGVGCHGQTVWHSPCPAAFGDLAVPNTLQVGSPAVLAERLGIPVVSDFRAADLALGGQGAPLVPLVDYLLLSHPEEHRVVLNLGGIANLTWLPASGSPGEVVAFDTGPANLLLDAAARHVSGGRLTYDDEGGLAAQGTPDGELLAWMLEHPYLRQPPPKSTGREAFGEEFFREVVGRAPHLGPESLLATLTAFTAAAVARAFEQWLPAEASEAEVILGGGGCQNRALVAMLAERLPRATLRTHEHHGIPSQAKEAMAFAILADRTLHGLPGNLPQVTGASRPAVLGSITAP